MLTSQECTNRWIPGAYGDRVSPPISRMAHQLAHPPAHHLQPGHAALAGSPGVDRLSALPSEVLKKLICKRDRRGLSGWGPLSKLTVASKPLYRQIFGQPLMVFPPPGPLHVPPRRGWGQRIPSPQWSWVRRGSCMARTDELPQKVRFPWAWKSGIREQWLRLRGRCWSDAPVRYHAREEPIDMWDDNNMWDD